MMSGPGTSAIWVILRLAIWPTRPSHNWQNGNVLASRLELGSRDGESYHR
jgi:hypothetical protein